MEKQVDAIFTADWHLRETSPVCRVDDFWETQWKKVSWLFALARKYDMAEVLHAGDLFDSWKPSPFLLSSAIERFPDYTQPWGVKFYSVLGNHDLPYHSLEHRKKCGMETLEQAGSLAIWKGCHWGQTPDPGMAFYVVSGRKVLIWHKYVWRGDNKHPGVSESDEAMNVLRRYGHMADVILTGDNHHPFVVRTTKGKMLVNPGGITRQTADQKSPRIYLYHAEDNSVTPVSVPHDPKAVSREHLVRAEEKENRMTAFVERLDKDWDVELSFSRNLDSFLSKNKIDKKTVDVVYRCIEEER